MRAPAYGAGLVALLVAAPARAHQDTVAYSRMSIHENGDVEYALKIPVEDLAESLSRDGHAALDAPEVRAAEARLFRHFQPLIALTSDGVPCPVERAGIDVPEDERLYGELRFVFHCPAGAPVTVDYRVFFDVDPGHMGMLEVATAGGTARAELIQELPRWDVQVTNGPPQLRAAGSAPAVLPPNEPPREPPPSAPPADAPRSANAVETPPAPDRSTTGGMLIALVAVIVVAGASAWRALRVARRRPSAQAS